MCLLSMSWRLLGSLLMEVVAKLTTHSNTSNKERTRNFPSLLRELDVARQAWLAEQPEAPLDLEVFGAIDEADHGSVTKAAEEAAQEILDGLSREDASGQQVSPQEGAESEGSPRLKPAAARSPRLKTASGNHAEQERVKQQSKDVPLVDPPEFGERVQDLFNVDSYWIPAAFPTILQNETGDPCNAPLRPVDLTPRART